MNVTSPITEALSQVNYTYDSVNQLMSATRNVNSNSDEIFSYDNLGNRLKKNNQATNNIFDNNNRIVEDDQFFYSHDDNGNMTKKINKSTGYTYKFIWDYENRLQFVTEHLTDGAVAIKKHTYMHDALGRRILKDSNGVVRKYIYDNEDILFEFDNADNLKAKFTHGPGIDEPVEMSRNNQSYFYHTDGLGSITGLSDSTGNIVQSYSYSSFGETKVYNASGVEINPSLMIQSPYGFTGREWDFETGMYHLRSRYYDPRTGRFISEDPIGFGGGDENLYRYVNNQATKFTDPSGLKYRTCTRPIDGLHGIQAGPVYHEYLEFDDGEIYSFGPADGATGMFGGVSSNEAENGSNSTCSSYSSNSDRDKEIKRRARLNFLNNYHLINYNCQDFVRQSVGSGR